MDNPENCCCREWAERLNDDIAFDEMAVTFDCQAHGRITLDKRTIPQPVVPPQPMQHRLYPDPRRRFTPGQPRA
jgi:hypothetical protein